MYVKKHILIDQHSIIILMISMTYYFHYFMTLKKSNNNNNIASNIFHDTILKNIAENIKNHPLYNEEIPSEIITIFYANGVISICLEYIKNPKKYTKNSILKYISKLIPDNLC